jgi:hypothetical protein
MRTPQFLSRFVNVHVVENTYTDTLNIRLAILYLSKYTSEHGRVCTSGVGIVRVCGV